jgi:hypothetical protein
VEHSEIDIDDDVGLGLALWWGRLPRRAWVVTVVLQAMLLAGAFAAMRSGEAEEDRVERIVGEAVLARHEEAAQAFLWTVGATLLITFVPLFLRGGAMRLGLAVAALASFVVAGTAVRVGKAGGELVYVHGAASVYAPAGTAQPPATHEDDDH